MNKFEELQKAVYEAKESIFSEMEAILDSCEEDVNKFYEKGNRSAGGRLRKSAQTVRKMLHFPTIRKQITIIEDAAKELRSTINDSK